MTIQLINIGTAPNDNTGDDPRTAGQKLNSNFTTSSHAASRDVGTDSGDIPDADDLNMVGATENYTSNNLNPNVFEGQAVNDIIAIGYAQNPTTAVFYLPVSQAPLSITTVGTFNVVDTVLGVKATGANVALAASSSDKLAVLIATISGAVSKETLILRLDAASSGITVNS